VTDVGAGGAPLPRSGRPAVLVSSTSWTPDEDFSLLLEALRLLDAALTAPATGASLPDVLVLITGKGPGKAAFEAAAAAAPLRRVAIRTLWLEPGDYPLLLGAADVGVSLHASTSGLDLPMKVVDMFGAGLPVAALGFECLPELVRHDDNGLIFRTAGELSEQLESLLDGFPDAQPSKGRLARLRRGVERGLENRWAANWGKVAMPLFY
jgi:beta-1,4-mannosyltransferase